jgi:Ca2+-dependent lipid-binding protein
VISVRVKSHKPNGKSWDIKIPFKRQSKLPDPFVQVKQGGAVVLKTSVSKNTLQTYFSSRWVELSTHHSLSVEVWDRDAARHDLIASINLEAYKHQRGRVVLRSGSLIELVLEIQ